MILIYSKDVDDFVNLVIDYLSEDFIRVGNRDYIHIDEILINEDRGFKLFSDFFGIVDFQKIKAIWFNGGGVNTGGGSYNKQCYQTLTDSFLTNLSAYKIGKIYNDFETNKIYASLEAQKQGFKVPETLITSNREKLKTFFSKYQNQNGIICKRIIDYYYYRSDDHIYNFNSTFLVDADKLKIIPNEFSLSLFQENILAEFEVRVVYIEGNFYGMSIHVFDNEIDYRKNLNSPENIRTIPFKLPRDIKIKLQNIFKNLNINFGSADLMYSNGEFYFLEINPSGQISFVNEACNFYIEKKISKLLENES